MSLPFSEELLSAYLDGELSPSEHELVDRLLGELPALREQLAELSQVGVKLRQLPREVAPERLRGEVLAAIAERTAPQVEAGERRLAARDVVKAGGALAACLAVGISIWMANRPAAGPDRLAPAESIAIRDRGRLDHTEWEAGGSPRIAAGALSENAAAPVDAESAEFARGASMSAAPMAAPVAAATMPREALAIDGAETALRERLLAPGHVPSAGELLSYLDVVNEQPVVVEYTVADVQSALGQVQVLLSRNGIRAVGEASGPIRVDGNGVVAIYLEASDHELSGVLDGIQSLPLVMVLDEAAPPAPATPASAADALSRPAMRQMTQSAARQGVQPARTLQLRALSDEAMPKPPAPPAPERLFGQEKLAESAPGMEAKDSVPGRSAVRNDSLGQKKSQLEELENGVRMQVAERSFQLALPKANELKTALDSRKGEAAKGREYQLPQQEHRQRPEDRLSGNSQNADEGADKPTSGERRRIVIFLQNATQPAASAEEPR